MSTLQAIPTANRLLAALPHKDYVQFLVNCEQVELTSTQVLNHYREPMPYVYFPINSFISLVTLLDEATGAEVGLIGNEGMLGVTLMLDVDITPFRAIVQGPGAALRIAVPLFRHKLKQCPVLQRGIKRYLFVLISQIAQAAVCNRFHLIESRLARWLLMAQDRSHSNTVRITHAFLSAMLGVRRAGISKVANSLQKRNIISYRRGNITILDRLSLETVSCKCYQANKEIYQRVMD